MVYFSQHFFPQPKKKKPWTIAFGFFFGSHANVIPPFKISLENTLHAVKGEGVRV